MKKAPSYTYQAPAPSWLFATLLNPFYERVANLYPPYWTPNGITVFGILCTLTASILQLIPLHRSTTAAQTGVPISTSFGSVTSDALFPGACVYASERRRFVPSDVSPLVYVIAGLLNLIYCIADNTDGKHARRWHMSSPIGEYLDHGLDCVTSLLSTACVVLCAGLSTSIAAVAVIVVGFVTTLSHTLNLRRGLFIWGTKLVSVDEAMVAFGLVPLLVAVAPRMIRNFSFDALGFPATRLVDILMALFLLSQVIMALTITRHSQALWVDPIVLCQAFLGAVLLGVARWHRGGAEPFIAAQFEAFHQSVFRDTIPYVGDLFASYPVLWIITAACCMSMVTHVAIATKCFAKTAETTTLRIGWWPVPAAAASVALFAAMPHAGCLFAVAVHFSQVLLNIQRIKMIKRGSS